MRHLSDNQLIAIICAASNSAAFSELVARHQSSLLAFLLRISGNSMDAEDLAQAALLKALRKINQFRGASSFKTWLFRIAYTEYLQLVRRRRSQARMEETLSQEHVGEASRDMDISIDIERALAKLSVEERAALVLCDAAGFSHREASVAMETPLGSIKTYVARARQKMRQNLEQGDR